MLWLKLLLVPGLVALVTLAVRRWGPAVGGWLAGLPVVAGPVLVFYALEQGSAFAARAAHATLAGLVATAAFAVASYAQRGAEAAVAFLNGYVQAIVGFGFFCAVMAIGLQSLGLGWTLAAALAAQLAWHGVLVSRTRPRASISHS